MLFHRWLDWVISLALVSKEVQSLLLERLHRQRFLAVLFLEQPCIVERDFDMHALEKTVSQWEQISLLLCVAGQ